VTAVSSAHPLADRAGRADRHGDRGPNERSRGSGAPVAPSRGHLRQVDLFRVVTFAAVVTVHALGSFTRPDDVPGNAALLLLHVTREAFFFLMAFVLMLSTLRRRDASAGTSTGAGTAFWRRRILLVGVPYVVWTVLYAAPTLARQAGDPAAALHQLGYWLLTGDARYHLYFLLVSLQLYLVFPLLVRLVRACAGHHVALLAASTALQVLTLWYIQDGPPAPGLAGVLKRHCHALLPTYQLWAVAGALAAVHLPAIQRWLAGRGGRIAAASGTTGVLTVLWYLHAVHAGTSPWIASSVFQPLTVAWFAAAIVGLSAAGCAWAARSSGGRLARALAVGSDLSFGIYLLHPAVLSALVPYLRGMPASLATPVAVTITLAVSTAAVAVIRGTFLSMPLAGRPRRRPRRRVERADRTERAARAEQSAGDDQHHARDLRRLDTLAEEHRPAERRQHRHEVVDERGPGRADQIDREVPGTEGDHRRADTRVRDGGGGGAFHPERADDGELDQVGGQQQERPEAERREREG
jgi:peptidoglycan/LPS O-acetylase OafA/YrhL